MNSRNSKRLAMAVTVALAALGSAAIFADTTSNPPTVRVRYGDLDLSREEGVKTLYSRLQAAARRVCDAGDYRALDQWAEARRCADKAVGDAVAALGNAQLSALHYAGGRERPASRIAAAGG